MTRRIDLLVHLKVVIVDAMGFLLLPESREGVLGDFSSVVLVFFHALPVDFVEVLLDFLDSLLVKVLLEDEVIDVLLVFQVLTLVERMVLDQHVRLSKDFGVYIELLVLQVGAVAHFQTPGRPR